MPCKCPHSDRLFAMAAGKAYDLDAATAVLQRVASDLSQCTWFAKNGWLYSVHNFPPPPAKAESVTLHVFKPGWFNDDRQGIHFETFISDRQWSSGTVPVMMHILHVSHIPETKLKRIKLSQPFIDKTYDLISSWPGYVFRTGKYGTHPFTCNLAFDSANTAPFIKAMTAEMTRLCKKLGPVMDETLIEVSKG